jgi:hypothetical protein
VSLPSYPPSYQSPVIDKGDQGWPVYAVQYALNWLTKSGLVKDGDFGAGTEKAAKAFQSAHGLTPDGIVGPATQAKMVTLGCTKAEEGIANAPAGLMRGMALAEGGLRVAPINAAIKGGVDCGPVQFRCYGPPYDMTAMEEAFSLRSIRIALVGDDEHPGFIPRRDGFLSKAWVAKQTDKYAAAGKVAALAHNWPSQGGADYYALYGHVYNPTGACSWLPRDKNGDLYIRFPDGVLVQTRQDWAEFYAIGGKHGPGMVTRYVTAWK